MCQDYSTVKVNHICVFTSLYPQNVCFHLFLECNRIACAMLEQCCPRVLSAFALADIMEAKHHRLFRDASGCWHLCHELSHDVVPLPPAVSWRLSEQAGQATISDGGDGAHLHCWPSTSLCRSPSHHRTAADEQPAVFSELKPLVFQSRGVSGCMSVYVWGCLGQPAPQ